MHNILGWAALVGSKVVVVVLAGNSFLVECNYNSAGILAVEAAGNSSYVLYRCFSCSLYLKGNELL